MLGVAAIGLEAGERGRSGSAARCRTRTRGMHRSPSRRTRAPRRRIATPSASGPRASTQPATSWPRISGKSTRGWLPSTMWRSVWHTPQPATRMRTSVPVGSGVGTSTTRREAPGASRRTARIGPALGASRGVLGGRRDWFGECPHGCVDQRVGVGRVEDGGDDPVAVDGDRHGLGDVDVLAVGDGLDAEQLDGGASLVAEEQEWQVIAFANSTCCCSESVLMPATAMPASRSLRWPATSASIAFMPRRRAAPVRVGAPKNSSSAGCFVTKLRRLSR